MGALIAILVCIFVLAATVWWASYWDLMPWWEKAFNVAFATAALGFTVFVALMLIATVLAAIWTVIHPT